MTSADDGEERNALIVGWGAIGTHLNKPVFTVYIHKTRYSQHIFDRTGYFSVSFFSGENRKNHIKALQYLGTRSGRDEDKIKGAGELELNWTTMKVRRQDIPYFSEAEYVDLCKKIAQTKEDINQIDSDNTMIGWLQKEGTHLIYDGEILKILKTPNQNKLPISGNIGGESEKRRNR